MSEGGVALVSGASSGLGRSVAVELVAHGWDVALGARRIDALKAVAQQIESGGTRAYVQSLDLRSAASIEAFVAGARKEIGPIGLLVNNAGLAMRAAQAGAVAQRVPAVFFTQALLRELHAPMLKAGADTIVLACTHYPFVLPLIRKIAGEAVEVIDPAPAVARQAA